MPSFHGQSLGLWKIKVLLKTGWPHNFHKKIPGLFKENHSFFKDNFKG